MYSLVLLLSLPLQVLTACPETLLNGTLDAQLPCTDPGDSASVWCVPGYVASDTGSISLTVACNSGDIWGSTYCHPNSIPTQCDDGTLCQNADADFDADSHVYSCYCEPGYIRRYGPCTTGAGTTTKEVCLPVENSWRGEFMRSCLDVDGCSTTSFEPLYESVSEKEFMEIITEACTRGERLTPSIDSKIETCKTQLRRASYSGTVVANPYVFPRIASMVNEEVVAIAAAGLTTAERKIKLDQLMRFINIIISRLQYIENYRRDVGSAETEAERWQRACILKKGGLDGSIFDHNTNNDIIQTLKTVAESLLSVV